MNHLLQQAVAFLRFWPVLWAIVLMTAQFSSPGSAILLCFICLVIQRLLLNLCWCHLQRQKNLPLVSCGLWTTLGGRWAKPLGLCVLLPLCRGQGDAELPDAASADRFGCLLVPQLFSQVWDNPLGLCCCSCWRVTYLLGLGYDAWPGIVRVHCVCCWQARLSSDTLTFEQGWNRFSLCCYHCYQWIRLSAAAR